MDSQTLSKRKQNIEARRTRLLGRKLANRYTAVELDAAAVAYSDGQNISAELWAAVMVTSPDIAQAADALRNNDIPRFTALLSRPRVVDVFRSRLYTLRQAYKSIPEDLEIPEGKYLSEIDFTLPDKSFLIVPTGKGKTTWAMEKRGRSILVMSATVAIEQQGNKYPNAGVYYGKKKTATAVHEKVIVTYDLLPDFVKKFNIDTTQYDLIIDEQHNLGLADYRAKALQGVIRAIESHEWKSICFMTGTYLKIPHPALAGFVPVYTTAKDREQKAQRVSYGKKVKQTDVITELVKHSNGLSVVFFQNKGARLDTLVATLTAANINGIYCLNSDSKYEAIGQHITTHETLPPDCQVLITTSVFVESANLRADIETAIIAGSVHPAYAQQFVNRIRGDKPPKCTYWINNGEDESEEDYFDINACIRHEIEAAETLAATINKNISIRGVEYPQSQIKTFAIGANIIKGNDNLYSPNVLGCIHSAYSRQIKESSAKPEIFKNETALYGWQWVDDSHIEQIERTAAEAGIIEHFKETCKEARDAAYFETLHQIKDMGANRAEIAQRTGELSNQQLALIERVLEVEEIIGDFNTAVKLLATANDSTQSFNRVKRLARLEVMKRSENQFLSRIVAKFAPYIKSGQMLTREERHTLLIEVYRQSETMYPFATYVQEFGNNFKQSRLKPRHADAILKAIFTVEDVQKRGAGERKRGWKFIDCNAFQTAVALGTEKLAATREGGTANLGIYKENIEFSVPATTSKSGTANYDFQQKIQSLVYRVGEILRVSQLADYGGIA